KHLSISATQNLYVSTPYPQGSFMSKSCCSSSSFIYSFIVYTLSFNSGYICITADLCEVVAQSIKSISFIFECAIFVALCVLISTPYSCITSLASSVGTSPSYAYIPQEYTSTSFILLSFNFFSINLCAIALLHIFP